MCIIPKQHHAVDAQLLQIFDISPPFKRHGTLASTEEKMMTAKPRTMTDMIRSPTFRAKTSIPPKKRDEFEEMDEIVECLDPRNSSDND